MNLGKILFLGIGQLVVLFVYIDDIIVTRDDLSERQRLKISYHKSLK